jgi:hypothetical protein
MTAAPPLAAFGKSPAAWGKAEMGPGHRQNRGQQQERHLDATGGHFSGEGGT